MIRVIGSHAISTSLRFGALSPVRRRGPSACSSSAVQSDPATVGVVAGRQLRPLWCHFGSLFSVVLVIAAQRADQRAVRLRSASTRTPRPAARP